MGSTGTSRPVSADLRPFAEYLNDADSDYEAAVSAYLADLVAAAPPLTAESLTKLRVLLSP
jgi:hypothetical protein